MPTTNPRVALTVKRRTRQIFTDTAGAMGVPASRLMTQVLEESQDGIEQLGIALVKAKAGSVNGLEGLAKALQEKIDTAEGAQVDLEVLIEKKKREKTPVKVRNQK